jgi:hypothetical protein
MGVTLIHGDRKEAVITPITRAGEREAVGRPLVEVGVDRTQQRLGFGARKRVAGGENPHASLGW